MQTYVSVPVQKPATFSYRCIKKINTGAFKQDLSHVVSQTSSLIDYNNHLCSLLDKHAPICRRTARTRKPTPWFSSIAEQFYELKQERRQAERRWLKSKFTVHKQIYDSIKQKITNLVDKAKQAYYSARIQSSTTCKQLFQNLSTILGKNMSSPLPSTFHWRPFDCLFWLKSAPSGEKKFSSKPSCLPWYLFRWKSIANFWACHWWICLKNNQQCTLQVLCTRSHSSYASLWKPWHPLADHQHISYHWHCTVLDNDNSSVLLLLDLSVAVDTVDHQILLSSLNCFWHSIYCTPMASVIPQTDISLLQSLTRQLMYGVPQGSVLGPVLFVLYTTPLSDVIANHCKSSVFRGWHTSPEIRSSQWSDQPHQWTKCMQRWHKYKWTLTMASVLHIDSSYSLQPN